MHCESHFPDYLVCPISGSDLKVVGLGDDTGFLSTGTGILFPVIDGVIVMEPVAPSVRAMCADFMRRNSVYFKHFDGAIDADKTRTCLCDSANPAMSWHQEEMEYWEQYFCKVSDQVTSNLPNWNRTLPRQRLLREIDLDPQKHRILEVGCGASQTLFETYGPVLKHYVGLDLSFHACRLTRLRYNSGVYIQGSLEKMPFKDGAFDAVVAYGVLHHLPEHEENVRYLLRVLRRGGLIIGADPLPRPGLLKKLRSFGLKNSARNKTDLRTGMSPHNDFIDWDNLLRIVSGHARVAASFHEYSPLRGFLVATLLDRFGLRSKALAKSLMWLDAAWLGTLGKLNPILGSAAVHYAIVKE